MDPGTRIYLPAEVALAQRDEVVSVLAALGAAVDISINRPHQLLYTSQSNQPSMNLLQWTSAVVEKLSKATSAQSQLTKTQDLPTSPADDTWTQYRAFLTAVFPTKEGMGIVDTYGPHGEVVAEHVPATRDYYAHAESILRSYSTVPYQELQSNEAPTSSDCDFQLQGYIAPQTSGYIRHVGYSYSKVPVPAHLKVLYDELYEACWTGDNATIQELCLPKHISDGKEPIQISVQTSFNYLHTSLNGLLRLTTYLRLSS